MSLSKLAQRLSDVGIPTKVEKKKLVIDFDGSKTTIDVSEDWNKEIGIYYRAKQYEFTADTRTLIANRSVEFCLRGLNRYSFRKPEYVFSSQNSDKLSINQASKRWILGFVMSDEFERYADLSIKRRLSRKNIRIRSLDRLFWAPVTARFETRKKLTRDDLLEYAQDKAEACLLKLAIDRNEVLDFSKTPKRDSQSSYENEEESEMTMPAASYCRPLAKFYKVAKSSQFPSQSFLSYYHVLEYQFYRTSDHNLYAKIRTQVNSTGFSGGDDDIRKILSVVYKHKQNLDETALLKLVLEYYIDEAEFIEFANTLDAEKFTKRRDIFGEDHFIKLEEGHALSNSARVIKHIRNYLVHSSDKITRDDRHVPLSDGDDVILDYLPIVEFLAEKVIFGCAKD